MAQAKLQSEDREKTRQHDLDRLRIESGVPTPAPRSLSNDGFKLASAVKFVHNFDDSRIASYLEVSEKAMLLHKFSRETWIQLLHTQLTGNSLKVFAELTVDECKSYYVLKMALLPACARVPEYYRSRFRSLVKGSSESYGNFHFGYRFRSNLG